MLAKVISALEKGSQWQVAVLLLFDMPKVCIEQELFGLGLKVQDISQTNACVLCTCIGSIIILSCVIVGIVASVLNLVQQSHSVACFA